MNSKRLDELLGGSPDDFNARWNETAPADDISVLPAGKYKALVVNGGLAESNRRRTPSYKVVFQVLTPPTFSNRKIFHDFWLSAAALPYAKASWKNSESPQSETWNDRRQPASWSN